MKRAFQYSLAVLILLLAQGILAYAPEDCVRCHKTGSSESRLHIPVQTYEASIHGREITCQECHTGVTDDGHKTKRGSGAVDCSRCHDQENRHGLKSMNEYRPQCYACHTAHAVFEKGDERSSVHKKNLSNTCKTCHPAECGQRDLLSWLLSLQISSHNKQDFGRVFDETNCVGCHQGMAAHGEDQPLDDQDCYQCHLSPKGDSLLLGYIHPKADLDREPTIFVAGAIYGLLILVLFSGGFLFYVHRFSRKGKARRK